jgi:hypothetical protein
LGVVTLFGLLLTVVGGVPQLFVYPDENGDRVDAKGVDKQQLS